MDSPNDNTTKKIRPLDLIRIPLVRVVFFAVLIVLLIIAAATVITGRSTHGKSEARETSFFYPLNTESILDMQAFPDGIAVLQANSVVYLDNGGNQIALNPHKYSNPVLRTAGNYALLFDRGANAYRIEKKALAADDVSVNSCLITADICQTGVYGYLLNADEGYQSHFFVFSAKNEKIFEWGSASDYATIVKLSENGKRAVVVAFGVENAEPYSKVFYFDFTDKKEIWSVKLSNTTVFSVKYVSMHEIAVFADSGIYLIKKDGNTQSVRDYSSTELNCACVNNAKLSVLSLNLYGNECNVQTVLFDRRLKKQKEFVFDEKVNAVFSDDDHAAVVTDRFVAIADLRGAVRTIELEDRGMKCLLRKNTVYVLTPGGIIADSLYAGKLSAEK